MTDHTRPVRDDEDESHEMDDLELITSAVNGHLSPERLEEVRRRLDTDPAFRDLAAPVLLTWSVPPRIEREPRPIGELERDWDEFARKAGIGKYRREGAQPKAPEQQPQQSHKPRKPLWHRLWYVYIILAVVYMITGEFREPVALWWRGELDSVPVPYDTGWIALGDRIDVRLTRGASLRVAREPLRGLSHVLLDGSARFRVRTFRENAPDPRGDAIIVGTLAGEVTAGEAEFTVTTRADTTDVEVHPTLRRLHMGFTQMTVTATAVAETKGPPLSTARAVYNVSLHENEGARIVRGRIPTHVPKLP